MAIKDDIVDKFFKTKQVRVKTSHRIFDNPLYTNTPIEQLGDNKGTIEEQLGDNKGTIEEQLGDNKGTIEEQLGDNKGTIEEQLGDNKGTNKGTIRGQILSSSLSHIEAISLIKKLFGLQKKIFFFIVENCKLRGSLQTDQITNESLRIAFNTTNECIKTTIKRLIKKGFFEKKEAKRGKGGYMIFILKEPIRNAGIELSSYTVLENELGNNKGTIREQIREQAPHSSSSIYLTTTTEALDVNGLSFIGLTQSHLEDILKDGKLTKDQIQSSIDHFAFDLEANDRAKTFKSSPLDVFMGILRKGSYYNAPSNYEPQNEKNKRLYLEDKMRQETAKRELEEKLKEVEFKEWVSLITEVELMGFYVEDKDISNIPEKVQKTLKRRNALNNARQYFESEVWPRRKIEIEKNNNHL